MKKLFELIETAKVHCPPYLQDELTAEIEKANKEYGDLLDDQMELIALQSAGVDNWQGYDDAMEILEDMKKDE